MKILIAPDISQINNSFLLANRLIHLIQNSGHECVISAPKDFEFSCTRYNAPYPRCHFFYEIGKSYEEWLFNTGRLDKRYLRKDISALSECISKENPDLILDLNRTAAPIVARIHHIPFYSFVSTANYRDKQFHKDVLAPLNSFLTENNLEQVLHVYDLYQFANKRIGFSQSSVQLFLETANVERYLVPLPEDTTLKAPSVSIYFLHTEFPYKKLTKIITDSFLHAPYAVQACIIDTPKEQLDNITFLPYPDLSAISRTNVVIHDGDSYLYHVCLTSGIPQVIINTGEPEQIYECAVTKRCGFGLTINEDELSVASLYEAYRRVTANSYYKDRAELYRKDINQLKPLDIF